MIIIFKKLEMIRKPNTNVALIKKIIYPILLILLGGTLGVAFKCFDAYLLFDVIPHIFSEGLRDIGNSFSFWIFTATIIACFSRSPIAAGFHSFCYLFSMVITYYIQQMKIYGYFATKYFIIWSVSAILAFICGYIVWYARGVGKFATFCSISPIALIIAEFTCRYYIESIRFPNCCTFKTHPVFFCYCILSAIILLIILPKNSKHRIWTLIFSIIIPIPLVFFSTILIK